MTPNQKFAMDLMDLSSKIVFFAHRLKNQRALSPSYADLFKSFAATVDQVAKEVVAS